VGCRAGESDAGAAVGDDLEQARGDPSRPDRRPGERVVRRDRLSGLIQSMRRPHEVTAISGTHTSGWYYPSCLVALVE
jgi:hypothetical protein